MRRIIMDYIVTIKSHNTKESVMFINEQLAIKLNITKKKRGIISFGMKKNYVDIEISTEVTETEISLSQNIIENLYIPTYPLFEVRVTGNEIIIGPCIGILASHKYEDITKGRLKEISMNTLAYSRIRGAVITFSLDKVNKNKQLVEGYCYNPEKQSWDTGVFPYPSAIYRRTALNDKWMNHFLTAIGDSVFSNYSFDKWDTHKWFSNEPEIEPFLPKTKIYNSKEDILEMLKTHKVIYVKPSFGMKGFGVVRISKDNGKVSLQYREDGENKNIIVERTEDLGKTFETLFHYGGYIIQQGLDLIRFDGGIVDFRCVMQKNEACKWICNGIIARIGAKESVVSNISSGGAALPGLRVMKEALNIPEEERFVLRERIISLCIKVCKALDEYGYNFGSLGLDIGIDKNQNIWLIEVNNRKPHPAVALRAGDIPTYYTILNGPLHYAKGLAGFGSKEV
jgi:glutathione synthase/RimK-type ligase-like ATP-grasp enzyme